MHRLHSTPAHDECIALPTALQCPGPHYVVTWPMVLVVVVVVGG